MSETLRNSADQESSQLSTSSEETSVTDIEISPDGRIFLFGVSPQVLQILYDCGLTDQSLKNRLDSSNSPVSEPSVQSGDSPHE